MAARPTTIMTTLRTFFLSFDLAGRLISIVLLLQKFLESCNCHVERAAMRARSDWNESAKTSRTTIQFSTSAQFKARATNGRIDWLGWRLSKIRDFCQFSKSPGYKLGQRREKAGSSGFGSGTRQSHFRNCTYEVLSSWYKIVYTHSKAGSG